MTKTNTRILLVLAASAALAIPLVAQVPAPPPPPAPASAPSIAPQAVVLTVGNEKITAKEFDDFVSDLPPQVQMMAQGPGKRMVAEELIKVKLLAQEAVKRGLDKTPKFARQMELMKDQMLASEVAGEVQKGVDDAALKKYYDDHKSEFEQVKARHILISTRPPTTGGGKALTDEEAKAKAEDIRKQLVAGGDFAKIAKAESADKGSAERGGDLGEFGRGMMVPAFEQAAFSLKVNDISEPIKTQYGYHIIQVQEKTSQPFEQVKDDLAQKLGPEKVEQLAAELRKSSKVEMNDAYFGPPGPPGLPPGLPPQQ